MIHCWNQIFRIAGFLGRSPNVNSSGAGNSVKVVTPSFTHLNITVSNQRFGNCSPTVDVGFVMLTSDSFRGNRIFKMNIQFLMQFTCAAVVVSFFETILNVRRSLSVSVDFHPLFLFADVVFSQFMCADVTLETVALDTRNNVAVFITDAHDLTSFKIRQVSHFTIPLHELSLNTITDALTQALQNIYKRKKNNQCCQLKFFQVGNTNSVPQFLSVSIILFTLCI
jgi:hypothetical protein